MTLTLSIIAFIATLCQKPIAKLKHIGSFSSFRPTNMYVGTYDSFAEFCTSLLTCYVSQGL